MATTTNFGWETPDDTDYVKDGAGAVRTLAGGIDTSLVDLKGGTTGQILSKATNTDMDYTWVDNPRTWTQVATATASSGFTLTASSLSGYKHYLFRWKIDTAANSNVVITFNGDTGANYQYTDTTGVTGNHHTTGQTGITVIAMQSDSVAYGGMQLDAQDASGLFVFTGWSTNYAQYSGHYDPSAVLSSITFTVTQTISSASVVVYGKA